MNEELQTVNAELKSKLQSISMAHSDLQNLIAATEVGTLFLDQKLRIRMFTPLISELFNIAEMDVGRAITDFTSRLEYNAIETDARRVLHDLSPIEIEVPSRDDRWFIVRLRPYRSVDDRIEGVVLTCVDITSRRRAEQQLHESQQSYQTLFDSIDEGFTVIEVIFEGAIAVDYRFEKVNAAFERQTGLPDAIGKTVRQMVPGHEEHWYEIYGRIAKSGKPERFEAPASVLGRYYDVYAFPVGAKEGHRVGVLFRDVSERKEAEAHREMLTKELSHRVKNTLAVVQALARSPSSPDQQVDEYRERFIGRIQALAKAHDQLIETRWQSADLRGLIDATLSVYRGTGKRDLIVAEGPDVLLAPQQGLGLALILHELGTNASKYGALSTDGGRLSLTWQREPINGGEQIRLTWRETGGPRVVPKTADGFGTKLIKRACTYELDGSADLRFDPDGLVAEIAFPSK